MLVQWRWAACSHVWSVQWSLFDQTDDYSVDTVGCKTEIFEFLACGFTLVKRLAIVDGPQMHSKYIFNTVGFRYSNQKKADRQSDALIVMCDVFCKYLEGFQVEWSGEFIRNIEIGYGSAEKNLIILIHSILQKASPLNHTFTL